MFVRPLHSPSQNCLIESVIIQSIRNSNDNNENLLLLDKDRQLILTEGLHVEIQFQINSSFSCLDSILKYSRGLQQWQSDVLYVEIRELLYYDEMEEKWKNIYDETEQNDLLPGVDDTTPNHSQSLFSIGKVDLDEDCNVITSLHVNVSNHKENMLSFGNYRLELRFFQYGGSTSSVFIPFTITSQSFEFLMQQSSCMELDSTALEQFKLESIPSQKQATKIMTTVSPSNHYIHTVKLEAHDNWTKLHFNRSHHTHFDYSKHSSSSSHGKNYTMTYSHANSNQSTRHKFSNSVFLPIQTQRKSLESIASKKFSKSGFNSKKSVILFVIGNGLDESKLPKGRVTILRPRRIVDPLTSIQMTAVQNQTTNLQTLLNNAPFCPVIFYDLNNGRTVRVVDIQFALHFVYERARQKMDTSNVIILCTWTFRMHQRIETLDNLFESVCSLPNVIFLSSAGNDGEDLRDSVVYPAICEKVLAVGSLDPNPELMNTHVQLMQSCQLSPNSYDVENMNIPPPIFRLNPDTNRGDPVTFYVRAESTSYAAIFASVVIALMWLLDTSNEQYAVRNLFLNDACTWVDCSRTQRKILALTNANNAIRRLMGQQDEQQIGGILIESESDDESLDEMQNETQRIAIQGGVLLESADNDSEDEDLNSRHDLEISESGFHNYIENDQTIRNRNQYMHALIKKLQNAHNPIFSSLGVCIDVTSDDIVDGEIIDNIVQKLQMRGNMNRVLLLGDVCSGKTLKLHRLIVRVCEQSLNSTNTTSNSSSKQSIKLDTPLTPFYVSLAGIKRKDNILNFIRENFSSIQNTLWEHSTNKLLVIDDFQESFNYDRDIAKLSEQYDDVKIVLASTNRISNPEHAGSFHIIEVETPTLDENPKEVLFGKKTAQKVPMSEIDIKKYVTWCKQHAPILLQSTTAFSAFLSTEVYRKQHHMPERTNSSIVSKLLQRLSSSYDRYLSVVEDLAHQFVDSLNEESLDGIDFPESTNANTFTKKKDALKRCILPVLSLFAFHVQQSSTPTFSEFTDPSKGKKYSFVFDIITRNVNNFKLFSVVEVTLLRKRNSYQRNGIHYRFSDPFFMKMLSANYILSTFSEKCRKKDVQSFYKLFYRQLFDPIFSDTLLLLRSTDSEFKKLLNLKGIDQLLTNSTDISNNFKLKKKNVESSQESSNADVKSSTPETQKQLEGLLQKLNAATTIEQKKELILFILSNSDHYDMYYSEKIVSRFISMLSMEKDSIIQQYLLKVICCLSSQCPDSMIQVVVRSIQVIASDDESEIRGYAIHQLKHFTTYADKDQMMHFLIDLFKKEKDEQIKYTILDTIGVLGSDRFADRKSIWFELGALDEDTDEMLVRVALLKTMSKLVSSTQHWAAVLQRLTQLIRNHSISSSDALFIYNELAANIFSVDDLLTISSVIEEYDSVKGEFASQGTNDAIEETDLLIKLEMIGNLLQVSESLRDQIIQRVDKSHNPSDESLQERLLDNLFSILKNGSNHACQKAVEVIEALPNNFSQRDNILTRTAECIASGYAGQSILAKRLIRLFLKFMDRDMESDTFWSCFVKLGYIVSDYDIDQTAHDVVLNTASLRSMKETRMMLDELVHHLHSCSDDTPHKDSLRVLIQKLYHYVQLERLK